MGRLILRRKMGPPPAAPVRVVEGRQPIRNRRWIILPGFIQSNRDEQTHYIGPTELMRLYKVRPDDCVVLYQDTRDFLMNYKQYRGWGLIPLRPQYGGNYQLPEQGGQ